MVESERFNDLTSLETPRTLRVVRYISARRSAIAPGDLVDMRGNLEHIVTTGSNKKFALTGSFVVTRRHAEVGTVYIDWNSLKTRVRTRAGKLRGVIWNSLSESSL